MKLVIIIPALNEEKTIRDVIAAIPANFDRVTKQEIVVIDDGSSDNTKSIAESSGATVISHRESRGVGAAFNTGIKAALQKGADIIVNIDGDGQFNPEDIPSLIKPILDGEAEFVTASRFMEPALTPQMPKIKIWGNKRMSSLISFLTGMKFFDVSCGFRAYSRDAVMKLTLYGHFTYTQETFLDLVSKEITIKEIPLVVRETRKSGESRVASNLWKYAAKTSRIILRAFRDYRPLKFFGYISLPFFILGLSLEIFLLIHYFLTGQFSPHKWAGFSGIALVILGLILFILGLVADMLDRIRMNQEELLYLRRKAEYDFQKRQDRQNR